MPKNTCSIGWIVRSIALVLICGPIGGLAWSADAEENDHRDAFLEWAKANARPVTTIEPGHESADLQVLKEMIGEARIIGIGESVHFTHELLTARLRLIEFLVEEMGVTAVTLESPLPASKMVYDYVLGGNATDTLWNQGLFKMLGDCTEARAIIEWMRAYNLDPGHDRKVRFYSVDFEGRGGGWSYAYDQIVGYLDQVTPEFAATVRDSFGPLVAKFATPNTGTSMQAYAAMSDAERHALSFHLTNIIDRLEVMRIDFVARSSEEEFDWAHRMAIALRQSDAVIRGTLDQATAMTPQAMCTRERMMSENILWVAKREGPDARVVFLAHNGHVQNSNPFGGMIAGYMPGGEYLTSMVGDDYLPLGFSVARGTGWTGPEGQRTVAELPAVAPDSLDGTLSEVGMPLFLIDLDSAPASGPVHEWLDQDRVQRAETMLPTNNTRASWGVLFFVEEVSPAVQVEQ